MQVLTHWSLVVHACKLSRRQMLPSQELPETQSSSSSQAAPVAERLATHMLAMQVTEQAELVKQEDGQLEPPVHR